MSKIPKKIYAQLIKRPINSQKKAPIKSKRNKVWIPGFYLSNSKVVERGPSIEQLRSKKGCSIDELVENF